MGPELQNPAPVSPISRSHAIGHIVSVTGSQAVVMLDRESNEAIGKRAELGAILKIDTPSAIILGLVSALSIPVPAQRDGEPEVRVAELELIGQLMRNDDGTIGSFLRGVTGYPSLGDPVDIAAGDELRGAYLRNDAQAVSIGTLTQDRSIPAMVQVDELLGKHCAILGSTGTGKSCGVAVLLRAILDQNKRAHILLLDPHNEYAECFGDRAEVITPDDLHLPFWLLTFEEMLEVVIGNSAEKSAEAEILEELIPVAKWRYATNRGRDTAALMKRGINAGQIRSFTVDTPVPYRVSDVIAIIDERMGRLENRRDLAPYRQLKTRLEAISGDPRYAFMFGSLTVQDHMAEIVGRLFRVPVQNKPIAILELTGVPSEIVNVVVSVICRMTFDFALWSGGNVPVTLVCEEAHRYVPNNADLGFEPTRRAIARIAKEGRKYGVSLCVVSQRPSELDSTILSQCNTVFSMRMSNERDQNFVRAAIFDTAASLLDFLPSMGPREAIVFGDGVTLPGRIRFADLPEHAMPRSRTARFTETWKRNDGEAIDLDKVVERWRSAESPKLNSSAQANAAPPAVEIDVPVEPGVVMPEAQSPGVSHPAPQHAPQIDVPVEPGVVMPEAQSPGVSHPAPQHAPQPAPQPASTSGTAPQPPSATFPPGMEPRS